MDSSLPDLEMADPNDYLCNECMAIISGPRWTCETCDDFDLCEKCHGSFSELHEDGTAHKWSLAEKE